MKRLCKSKLLPFRIRLKFDHSNDDFDGEKCRICKRDLREIGFAFFCTEDSNTHERFRLCLKDFYNKKYYLETNKICHDLIFCKWDQEEKNWEATDKNIMKTNMFKYAKNLIKALLPFNSNPARYTNQFINESKCSVCENQFDKTKARWLCINLDCNLSINPFELCTNDYFNRK
jgi:hypothetical protein